MGYSRAGFKVVGVDITKQPDYPFESIRADILTLDPAFIAQFDLVHSSPPCQAHSWAAKRWKVERPRLIPQTRALLEKSGRPFVIENVLGAPIRHDLMLCGTMFGLQVIRHRFFELHGFSARKPSGCRHYGTVKDRDFFTVAGHGGDGGAKLSDWQKAMGIDWIKDKEMLTEAIPPAYGEYIGRAFLSGKSGAWGSLQQSDIP